MDRTSRTAHRMPKGEKRTKDRTNESKKIKPQKERG